MEFLAIAKNTLCNVCDEMSQLAKQLCTTCPKKATPPSCGCCSISFVLHVLVNRTKWPLSALRVQFLPLSTTSLRWVDGDFGHDDNTYRLLVHTRPALCLLDQRHLKGARSKIGER